MSEKKYIKGINFKKSKYSYKLSIKADVFTEQIKSLANDKGYVNIEVKERKEPDQYGNTHYVVLDEWKPSTQGQSIAHQATLKPENETSEDLPW